MCALRQTAPINETVEKHSAPSWLQSKSGRKSGSLSSGVYANHRVSEVFTVCDWMPVSASDSAVWVYVPIMVNREAV